LLGGRRCREERHRDDGDDPPHAVIVAPIAVGSRRSAPDGDRIKRRLATAATGSGVGARSGWAPGLTRARARPYVGPAATEGDA
jgi:hypothetical protein